MILKLKVKYQWDTKVYEPTNIFHLNDFVSATDLPVLLSEAYEFVHKNDMKDWVINHNEIRLRVTRDKSGFIVGFSEVNLFNPVDLENLMTSLTGLSRQEIYKHCRKHEYVIPRFVSFAALRFFGYYTYPDIQGMTSFNHATIIHGIKAISSFLASKNHLCTFLVEEVANRFHDQRFIDFCKGEENYLKAA